MLTQLSLTIFKCDNYLPGEMLTSFSAVLRTWVTPSLRRYLRFLTVGPVPMMMPGYTSSQSIPILILRRRFYMNVYSQVKE